VTPCYGVLILFLLERGLIAGEKLKNAKQAGCPLIAFARIAHVLQGLFGMLVPTA
jgi:hypothetical protein